MARIPEGEIERLKREVSLERLMGAAGSSLCGMERISLGCVRFMKTMRRR